jgi:RNA polymerase sigma factor (sigma-70 family)
MIQVLRFIRTAVPEGETDRDLLARFALNRDEAAFAAIVRRYGAGIWAACRRLADQDAEDAFQAVFLILARKAGSVSGSLPAWLHGVARRVAANLRRSARRRVAVEATAARSAEIPPPDQSLREGLAALDDELTRLPERYRAVLIVCCLEGRSRDEAASQLGWSQEQVKGRLERAREMLRRRLGRRGIELGGVLLAAAVSGPASASPVPILPPAALLVARASPVVLSLAKGVINAMLIQKIKVVATVLMLAATAGAVTYRDGRGGTAGELPDSAPATPTASGNAEELPVKTPTRWEKRLQDKDLTAKQRAAYEQIAKLHTVKLDQGDWGSIQIPSFGQESKIPTDVLYQMGMDVLPILAEALDDETPTKTVTDNRRGPPRNRGEKVWKVNELVALLIVRIADRDFVTGKPDQELTIREIAQRPQAAPEFRKMVVEWHDKFAAKTPTERKIADVTDSWFRNRFDAIIWLGEKKAKDGRVPIAASVDAFYADPKRTFSTLTRAEMSHCSLALGQIRDEAGLPQVRKVCKDMSYWLETYGIAGSAMLEDLFRAYQGLALLGYKDEAIKELERLLAAHGAKIEASFKKEYAERLTAAKDW